MPKSKGWRDVLAQLHESIEHEETLDKYAPLDDGYKTPAMLRWEKRFNVRIDVGLLTQPIVCPTYPRLCTRVTEARCFYHRYGQIDPDLVRGWRVICRLAMANKRVAPTLKWFQELRKGMIERKQKKIPLILTEGDLRVIIQALSMVPEKAVIE